MPLMRPLAIDGAAPSTTTKKIAPSVSWNSRIASGNHAIDGIVWRPVIIEPIAGPEDAVASDERTEDDADHEREREAQDRAHAAWSAGGLGMSVEVVEEVRRRRSTGGGSTNSGFQPHHTTSCQTPKAIAIGEQLRPQRAQMPRDRATSAGRAGSRARRARRAPRRAVDVPVQPSSSSRVAMAAHLLAQRSVIVAASVATSGESMRRGRGIVDRELGDDAPGPAREQHDAVAEADRLAHVVGDEQRRSRSVLAQMRSSSSWRRSRVMASSAPNGSSMSSTSASCDERAGERDALAHAARQLVRPLLRELVEVDELEQLVARAPCARALRDAVELQRRGRRCRAP